MKAGPFHSWSHHSISVILKRNFPPSHPSSLRLCWRWWSPPQCQAHINSEWEPGLCERYFCYQIPFLLREIFLIYEYVWVVHWMHTIPCCSQKRALNSLQPDLQMVVSCLDGDWEPNLSPSKAVYAHRHWVISPTPLWDFWSVQLCLRFGSFHIWDQILLCCGKLFPVPFFSAFWPSRHQALLTFITIQDLWYIDIFILHCGHNFSSVWIMNTFIYQPYKITWETVSMHFQIFMEKQNHSSSGFLMNTLPLIPDKKAWELGNFPIPQKAL